MHEREAFRFSFTVADLGGGSHPPSWQKRKPQKEGRIPTGATNTSSRKKPSSAPDSSSAAKSKKTSVSSLVESPTQTTQTPIPAQEVAIPSLAMDTETPKSKTLATENPTVPSSATNSSVPTETGKATATDKAPPPIATQQSPADLWKGFPKTVRKTKGTTPVETFETVASNYRGTGTQKNSAVVRSSSEQSDHTVSTHHDLSNGSLYVDLSADGKLPEQLPSSTSSSDSSLSADEDDPDDDSDEFIDSSGTDQAGQVQIKQDKCRSSRTSADQADHA
ncbi:hypothetical protein HID58_005234 [Brassica napus]|uniref:Uncharacterized protein n=1 Tax=Brassica napus TaxID=3708 RepID=A0ABQ8E8N4_BRANA|nr:hypothetical protein HID58_005234 [Brassica napus]